MVPRESVGGGDERSQLVSEGVPAAAVESAAAPRSPHGVGLKALLGFANVSTFCAIIGMGVSRHRR